MTQTNESVWDQMACVGESSEVYYGGKRRHKIGILLALYNKVDSMLVCLLGHLHEAFCHSLAQSLRFAFVVAFALAAAFASVKTSACAIALLLRMPATACFVAYVWYISICLYCVVC